MALRYRRTGDDEREENDGDNDDYNDDDNSDDNSVDDDVDDDVDDFDAHDNCGDNTRSPGDGLHQ